VIAASKAASEPWRRRLYIPNYQIRDAARYAHVSTQTVAAWHKIGDERQLLPERASRESLSYMQLIEIAVVAAARKAGFKLKDIAAARAYAADQLKSEFPFAEHSFKMNGRDLFLDYKKWDPSAGAGRLVSATQNGQMAWEEILGQLKEFEYEDGNGIALRWHVGGHGSPVFIDPRLAFGAPNVKGVPTWALKGRWVAGDSPKEIAEDYALSKGAVEKALEFEGIDLRQSNEWVH